MTQPHINHKTQKEQNTNTEQQTWKNTHILKHTNLEYTRQNKTTQRFGNRFCFRLQVKTYKGTYLDISSQDRVGTTGDIGEIYNNK